MTSKDPDILNSLKKWPKQSLLKIAKHFFGLVKYCLRVETFVRGVSFRRRLKTRNELRPRLNTSVIEHHNLLNLAQAPQ